MRLDFNILWVEDQSGNVDQQQKAIDRRMRAEGFRLQVKFATSIEEAETYLESDIYGDHIDLILMDYDLGVGPSGDEGLEKVRATFPYKDVIFYSAGAADLSKLVADKQVDGVFCSTREDLPEEVVGLFQTLIKKVLDIDHARGIVMGSSSDIDGLVFDSLAEHCRKGEGKLTNAAKKVIVEQLKDIRKSFDKTLGQLDQVSDVESLRELHLVYSSSHRHRLLRKLLEELESYEVLCNAMKDYASKTMPKRNDLAHVRVEKQGFSRKLYDRKGNEITRDHVRELRLELLAHQEALETLVKELKSS